MPKITMDIHIEAAFKDEKEMSLYRSQLQGAINTTKNTSENRSELNKLHISTYAYPTTKT